MAQAERRLLAREARGAGRRQVLQQRFQLLRLAALRKRAFELRGVVEMLFDRRLVAPGYEHKMLDPG